MVTEWRTSCVRVHFCCVLSDQCCSGGLAGAKEKQSTCDTVMIQFHNSVCSVIQCSMPHVCYAASSFGQLAFSIIATNAISVQREWYSHLLFDQM